MEKEQQPELEEDIASLDAIVGEAFLFFAAATDGIVINDAKATANIPCRCTTIQKLHGTEPAGTEEFCFKEGIVGALSQAQVAEYCKEKFPLNDAEGFRRHIEKFQEASVACVEQGANTLEARIQCMGKELRKRSR